MQTFLPLRSFELSARVLDSVRLNKQISECQQILNTLSTGSGWVNHPAVQMWSGYELVLVDYAAAMMQQFMDRGGSANHKSWNKIMDAYGGTTLARRPEFPSWLGDEEFHSSHRSRLLHKGNVDVVRKRLKIHLKAISYPMAIDYWVTHNIRPMKKILLRDLTVEQLGRIIGYLNDNEVEDFPNWYDQFNWIEEPGDDYKWPSQQQLVRP